MERGNVTGRGDTRYVEGLYKCFILEMVNYATAKVLMSFDGRIYNIKVTDLKAQHLGGC